MSDDAAVLLAEIGRVFAKRAKPDSAKLVRRELPHADTEEGHIAAFLQGRDWRQLDLATIRAQYPGDPRVILLFLRSEAFAFYLPAFLRMALDGVASDEWDMTDSLTFALTPRADDDEQQELFAERVSDLRPAERTVVRDVLAHLAHAYDAADNELNPARRALAAYWEHPEGWRPTNESTERP